MTHSDIMVNWDLEKVFDALNQTGFAIIDQLYPESFLSSVRHECLNHLDEFREAAIQNGVVTRIRSDHILWIDHHLPYAEQHTQLLLELGQQFNRYFYSNIREVEAHFAYYDAGEFYALHRDNPQQKNNRILSCVLYVNETWQSEWGGQLRLQDKNDQWHILEPKANRLVIFYSDLLHEVLAAQHQRLSITAWLRSQTDLW